MQGCARAVRHGTPSVIDEVVSDRARVEDGVAPVVQADALGKQLGTDPVGFACNRVNPKSLLHRQPGGSTGVGRSGGWLAARHGPWRR